jgi:Cdc6-like AAA superfamily ATPase
MHSTSSLLGKLSVSRFFDTKLNLRSEISQAMKDRVERRAVLDWLTLTDYSTHQSDSINRRQEGTGLWLLNSTEFQEWVNHSKKTLFCPGIPGAGKTIMSSIVVDHLNTKFESDAGVGLAYIYCSYQSQQKQEPEDLLMSLLKQLTQGRLSVPESVKSLYEYHKNQQVRPSCNEIVKTLHSTINLYSRVFVIIDALDEYHISNNERLNRLLSEVFGLQEQTEVNFFATSRPISEITSQFDHTSQNTHKFRTRSEATY